MDQKKETTNNYSGWNGKFLNHDSPFLTTFLVGFPAAFSITYYTIQDGSVSQSWRRYHNSPPHLASMPPLRLSQQNKQYNFVSSHSLTQHRKTTTTTIGRFCRSWCSAQLLMRFKSQLDKCRNCFSLIAIY